MTIPVLLPGITSKINAIIYVFIFDGLAFINNDLSGQSGNFFRVQQIIRLIL